MDDEIVSRIMDKAATADRRALFAALQAAVHSLIDYRYGRITDESGITAIEKALDLGAPYGSPEHIESLDNPPDQR
jgi:hypothetical protein